MNQILTFNSEKRLHSIRHVLIVVVCLNLLIAFGKYGYGTFMQSTAMKADGIHSLFDCIGNIIGIVGISLASRPADYDHPYGHRKFETFASVLIGVFLIIAAIEVGYSAIEDIINHDSYADVTIWSYIVMIVTLIINISVTSYEKYKAKQLSSEILKADSAHTFSDMLVSVGVIVGFIFVQLGYAIADSIMALIVMVVIFITAVQVFKSASVTLSDHIRIPENDLKDIVQSINGVISTHHIRSRGTEEEIFIDLHILVDPNMSVADAHKLCDQLEKSIKNRYPNVHDTVVHVEPYFTLSQLEQNNFYG